MPEDRMMPNDALRLLFLAIEQLMGADGTKAVLRGAKLNRYIDNYPPHDLKLGVKFSEYGMAEQAVEDFYGARGSKVMLMQVGRSTFTYGMKEQSAVLGLAGQSLKAMPLARSAKTRLLLDQICVATNKTVNLPARIEEDCEALYWVTSQCMCEHRPKHKAPCCFVTVGALTEAMYWLTDKSFRVQEVECKNLGASACRYRIPRTPVE